MLPYMLDRCTMLPPSVMTREAARDTRNAPVAETRIAASQSPAVSSSNECPVECIARLTRASRRP